MGDIADDCIERGLAEITDPEFVDETTVRCKFCQRDGFHWEQVNGRWRLLTASGKPHTCKRKAGKRG